MINLRYFQVSDFACKCGRPECNAVPPSSTLMQKIDDMRLQFGEAINITSGSRCDYQNDRVGGAKDSQHLLGRAADIPCDNGDYMYRLVKYAMKQGFTGIGIKAHMVHLDIRQGQPVFFGYKI